MMSELVRIPGLFRSDSAVDTFVAVVLTVSVVWKLGEVTGLSSKIRSKSLKSL